MACCNNYYSCGCANSASSNSCGCNSCGCNSCGCNSCGCNNTTNTANTSNGYSCENQLRRCHKQLERAVDIIEAIETLADTYLYNYKNSNHDCGCNNNTANTANTSNGSCGCNSCRCNSCGCNNYWGR